MRRNSLHRVRKRGVTRLRNRSNATKTEREGVENFSYLAKDVACRLFALVFCTKFHLLQIPYTSTAWVLTSLRLLMFGLVCIKKNPPLQLISLARRRWFLYDRDVFDALLRSWIILFYKPRVFWFLRIGKQFGDNKKTRSDRRADWYQPTWISLLTSQQATTTGSLRTWIRFLFPQIRADRNMIIN